RAGAVVRCRVRAGVADLGRPPRSRRRHRAGRVDRPHGVALLTETERTDMKQQTDVLRHEIEQTREALGDCIEELATRAERAVAVRHQLREHPWLAMATAVAAGFLLGQIGNGAPERAPLRRDAWDDRDRADDDSPLVGALSWLTNDLDVLANAAART